MSVDLTGDISRESPALRQQSVYYPMTWNGRVPKRVRMAKTASSEAYIPFTPRLHAFLGMEYDCWVDKHGAVAVAIKTDDGVKLLSVNPFEFEVIAWHEPGTGIAQ